MNPTAKTWKPFRRQEEYGSLPDSIFEGLYGGAAGGGKSELLLMLPIMRGFYKHPKFKGIIFRRTYPELEKEIILRSQDWYPATGAVYNDEKKRWKFPSGAIMQFGHAEFENDVRKYDTTEYNLMEFDELTSFTEFQYTYLTLSRCRSSTEELPAIVRSATNPGNVGHSWVRKRFIESGPRGSILYDPLTKTKRIFVQSLYTDNPHIDPGYGDRLAGLPVAERRAKRDGDWWFFAGQVFDDWRESPLSDEPTNASHVCEPFQIPLYWPRILAIDWGYNAMTIALWGAISPDLRLYLFREFSCREKKISYWASEVGRLNANEPLVDAVICRSAYQTRGDELTIAEQFEKHSGIQIRGATNDRVAGLILMREYIRWRQKPDRRVIPNEEYNSERALEILRKFGTPAYKQYLDSFQPSQPETNLPRLQVFPQCEEFRKCIPLCVYNEKKKDDIAEFDGDDPYDCGRYLIVAADDYMQPNPTAESHRRRAEVLHQREVTGDETLFYRQMAALDREEYNTRPFKMMRRY